MAAAAASHCRRCLIGRRRPTRSSTLCAWARSSSSSRAASAGPTSGRWLGRCPGCGAFGTLVEELHGTGRAAAAAARARRPERLGDVRIEEAARFSTGVPELDRVLGGGLVPASLVLLGGEPGVGKSTLLLSRARGDRAQRAQRAARDGGGVGRAGPPSRRATRRRRRRRDPRRDGARRRLRDARARRPAVCVIDSVQTLYAGELGSAPGSVAQVREAASRLLRVAKENGVATILVGHVTKDGVGRRPARARAPRRLRAPVRGRPVPRAPHPPVGEEPVRLDERARRVRDDRGTGSRACPSRRCSSARRRRARSGPPSPSRSRGRGRSCSRSRRSSPDATSRCRDVWARASIPKRLAMIVAVLGRHASVPLGSADVFVNVAGGVRIDEPGADLAIALAIASAARGAPA